MPIADLCKNFFSPLKYFNIFKLVNRACVIYNKDRSLNQIVLQRTALFRVIIYVKIRDYSRTSQSTYLPPPDKFSEIIDK